MSAFFLYNQSKISFLQIIKIRITGNLYKIIKSMYDDPILCTGQWCNIP